MGRLATLLQPKQEPVIKTRDTIQNTILETKSESKSTVSPETKSGIFELSKEDFEIIKNSVVSIDTTDKKRKDIIIGMYGSIKNPKTGDRFSIPTLSWDDEEYTYQYANYMKTLVNRPEEFKKVMNWE